MDKPKRYKVYDRSKAMKYGYSKKSYITTLSRSSVLKLTKGRTQDFSIKRVTKRK